MVMLHCDYFIYSVYFISISLPVFILLVLVSNWQVFSPHPFAPFGELLHVHSTDEGETQYEIYKI